MSINPGEIGEIQRAIAQSLRDHWKSFLVKGIVLVVLGILAIVVPQLATLTFTFLIGWLLLISGAVGLVSTFMSRQAAGFWWSLLSAALAIVVGILLLARPVIGAISLTYLLIVFFVIEGVAAIMFALEHKKELSGRWVWMLVTGVIDLVLAAMILAGLPSTAEWAIGLLLGINLLFGGTSLVAMALCARSDAGAAPAQKAA
jgi:uncharacterized membrane protein HdeD (DUF308 family)